MRERGALLVHLCLPLLGRAWAKPEGYREMVQSEEIMAGVAVPGGGVGRMKDYLLFFPVPRQWDIFKHQALFRQNHLLHATCCKCT